MDPSARKERFFCSIFYFLFYFSLSFFLLQRSSRFISLSSEPNRICSNVESFCRGRGKNLPFFFFSSFCSEENSQNVRIVRGRFVRGRGNGFHYRWLVVICGSGSTERVGEFTLNARQGRRAGDTQRGRQRK